MKNDAHTSRDPRKPRCQNRLRNIDALRGFALFGILAVNIWAFADPYYATPVSNPSFDSPLDHVMRFVISLVFETKFYLLFSFLFGYSFTLQMEAAERAEEPFAPRMLRRQGGLLAIGLLHGAVLYYGEILSTYAILGLVLLLFRGISPATAVKIGVVLISIFGVAWVLLGVLQLVGGSVTGTTAPDVSAKLAAFRGDATSAISYHAGHLIDTLAAIVALQAPSALAMFLFGFAAGRVQLFANLNRFALLRKRILLFGLPFGLMGALFYALAAAYAPGGGIETLALGVGQLTAPLLSASYVVGGLWLLSKRPGRTVEDWLAPAGKIALTNYLLQSLTLGILFTGLGWGLIDQIPPVALIAIVPAIFFVQLALSRWWLRGHLYGPAEWALRAVTVAGIPPWRRMNSSR